MNRAPQIPPSLHRNATEGDIFACPVSPSWQRVPLGEAADPHCTAPQTLLQEGPECWKGHLKGLPGHPVPEGQPVSAVLLDSGGLNGLEGHCSTVQ